MPKFTQFYLPVPKGTKINSEFGSRAISENGHQGIDFNVLSNIPITSVESGTVIRIIPNHKDYGNSVIIKHSDDQATLYAHLNRVDIELGQEVSKEQQIGLSGTTGRSTGPHLHFEVIEGAENVNEIIRYATVNNLKLGISGVVGRVNPRQFFAHYSSTDFPSEVSASKSGTGLLQGDTRENLMRGNTNPNEMSGLSGFDTYYVNFGDTISDVDANGRIVIDNGVDRSVLMEGNAIPKKDAAGNIVEGQWSLNGYDLIRDGDDLLVAKAARISEVITIKNYPFALGKKAFRITLGKELASGYEVTPKRLDYSEYSSKSIIFDRFTREIAIPSKDRAGRFMIPSFQRSRLHPNGGVSNVGIAVYDDQGNRIGFTLIIDLADQNERVVVGNQVVEMRAVAISTVAMLPLQDGNHVMAFSYYDKNFVSRGGGQEYVSGSSSIYYCIIGDDGSLVSGPALVAKDLPEPDRSQIITSVIGISDADEGINIQYVDAPEGVTKNLLVPDLQIANLTYPDSFTLPTVVKVDKYSDQYAVYQPLLQDMAAEDVPDSEVISSGSDVVAAEDSLKQILTFEEAVDAEVFGQLKITPVPNAKFVIRGIENGEIDLSSFGLTPDEIAEATTEVYTSQYSMEDLLDGEYVPDLRERRDVKLKALMPRREDNFEIDEEDLQEHDRLRRGGEDFEGDDYYEDEYVEVGEEEDLEFNPDIFTVINLPNNQQLIFPGINRENLLGILNPQQNITTTQTPTLPGPGGDSKNIGPVALGLIIGGVVVVAALTAIGTYRFITDAEFRQNTIDRARRVGSALNPMKLFRKSTAVAPENLEQITDGEEEYVERASEIGGPLHEEGMDQIIDNPVFREEERPKTPPIQLREASRLVGSQQAQAHIHGNQ